MVELTGYYNDNDDIYKRNMKTITNVIAMGWKRSNRNEKWFQI